LQTSCCFILQTSDETVKLTNTKPYICKIWCSSDSESVDYTGSQS
jgi:hypothetical protein